MLDLAAPLSQILSDGTQRFVYGMPAERLLGEATGAKTWYLTDALGSLRATLDDAGVPLAAANYDAWGVPETPLIASFGFTGELQQGSDVWLRARWYGAGRGSFGSRDPYAGDAQTPYSMQYYQYGYSAPTVWTDASGACAAPPSGSGDVICVDFFIAAARIGPGGAGLGDNRTFSTDSAPIPNITGSSRASLYIYLNKHHAIQRSDPQINSSFVQPLISLVDPYTGSIVQQFHPITLKFGPYYQYERFTARAVGGAIQVDWHLLNGATGAIREQRDTMLAQAGKALGTRNPLCLGLAMVNATLFQIAEWMTNLDAIDGTMSLEYLARTNGRYRIRYLQRDPYPSMEVYFYQNGRYRYTIYQHTESPLGPEKGLLPSAPREIVDNR